MVYHTFEDYLNTTDKAWFNNNPSIDLQTSNSLEHKTYQILITNSYNNRKDQQNPRLHQNHHIQI